MLPQLQYIGTDERGRERYSNVLPVIQTVKALRAKPASQLTPEERAYLVRYMPMLPTERDFGVEHKPVPEHLQDLGVFEHDLPRKAGTDMGQVLKIRGLMSERVTPEALQAAGLTDRKLIGRSVQDLYALGVPTQQAEKVAHTVWQGTGNDVPALMRELPSLRLLTSLDSNNVHRQRIADSVEQSIRFFKQANSETYRKTTFNHVVEGNAPQDVSLFRNSALPATYPLVRLAGEATREFFTRPDEYLENKPTPYKPPTSTGQAVREALIGTIPSLVIPSAEGNAWDYVNNVPLAGGAISTINKMSKARTASTIADALAAAGKAAEVAPALRSAGTTVTKVDDLFRAISAANGNKAISRDMLSKSFKTLRDVPDFLKPHAVQTQSGVYFDITPEVASKLGIEPAQAKLLNEANYGSKVANDLPTQSGVQSKLNREAEAAGLRTNPVEAQAAKRAGAAQEAAHTAAEEADYRKLVAELMEADEAGNVQKAAELEQRLTAMEKAKSTLKEVYESARARKGMATLSAKESAARRAGQEQAQAAAARRAGLEETGPRPVFEPETPSDEIATFKRNPNNIDKEKVLGQLQAGTQREPGMASPEIDFGKDTPPKPAGVMPALDPAMTKQIAQQRLLGNPLTPQQEAYAKANSKAVDEMVNAERQAATVTGEPAGALPPSVTKAASEASAAQAPQPVVTPATVRANVDEAAQAADIKGAPLGPPPAEPPPAGFLSRNKGKLLTGGLAGAAGYQFLGNAFKAADEAATTPIYGLPPAEYNAIPTPPAGTQQMDYNSFLQQLAAEQQPAQAAVQPQPTQAPVDNYVSPNIPVFNPTREQTTLVQPQGRERGSWLSLIGDLANAVSVGAETYNTGTDARRQWADLALRNAQESKVMDQASAAAMQDFYARRQALMNQQLQQTGYGFPTMKDMLDYKAKLAQETYDKNLRGKSQQEQADFMWQQQMMQQMLNQ